MWGAFALEGLCQRIPAPNRPDEPETARIARNTRDLLQRDALQPPWERQIVSHHRPLRLEDQETGREQHPQGNKMCGMTARVYGITARSKPRLRSG